MPHIVMPGERRMAVLSAPTSSAIAVATSTAKRARFAMEPPYSSVRVLGAWGEELSDQIAGRAVNLDTISVSLNRVARRKPEVGDGPAHFLGRQRTLRG